MEKGIGKWRREHIGLGSAVASTVGTCFVALNQYHIKKRTRGKPVSVNRIQLTLLQHRKQGMRQEGRKAPSRKGPGGGFF